MIPAQNIVKALSGVAALLAVCALTGSSKRSFAQGPAAPVLTRSSGPILAGGGEIILLCAANNQPTATTTAPATAALTSPPAGTVMNATLEVLNGITGAILAQRQVSLPPLGSNFTPPDPCLAFSVPPPSLVPSTNLFVIRVALNPQPLPPGICARHTFSVALQVYTPDSSGNPSNIRSISFEPPDPCIF